MSVKRFEVVVTDHGEKWAPDSRYQAEVRIHHPDQRDPWDETVAGAAADTEDDAISRALEHFRTGAWSAAK